MFKRVGNRAKNCASDIVAITVIATLLIACQKKDPSLQFLESLTNTTITPGYQSLYQNTITLNQKTQQCDKDAQNTPDTLKPYWQKVMASWQAVQWVKFGPIKEGSREWQLQFWPDKKNIIGRKVNALLTAETLDKAAINKSGVLVQGLSALEYILYDKKAAALTDSQRRCQLVVLISEKMHQLTDDINNDWNTYIKHNLAAIVKHDPKTLDNTADMISSEQGVIIVIKSLVESLDVLVDKKIASPLALDNSAKKQNPYFLESWRSGISLSNIRHNSDSIQVVFNQGGLLKYLRQNGHGELADTLKKKLTLNNKFIDKAKMFSHGALLKGLSENGQADLLALHQHFDELRRLIKVDMVAALNIQLGFNSNDGDS